MGVGSDDVLAMMFYDLFLTSAKPVPVSGYYLLFLRCLGGGMLRIPYETQALDDDFHDPKRGLLWRKRWCDFPKIRTHRPGWKHPRR